MLVILAQMETGPDGKMLLHDSPGYNQRMPRAASFQRSRALWRTTSWRRRGHVLLCRLADSWRRWWRVLVNAAIEEQNTPVIPWLITQCRDTKSYKGVLAQELGSAAKSWRHSGISRECWAASGPQPTFLGTVPIIIKVKAGAMTPLTGKHWGFFFSINEK